MSGYKIGFESLSVRKKLIVTCGFLALVSGLIGSISIWALSKTNDSFQSMVNKSVPAIIYLEQAERDMLEAQVPERSLMFMKMGTPSSDQLVKEHQENIQQVEEGWAKYKTIPASATEKELWGPFETAWTDWKKTSSDVLKILAEDTPSARRDAIDIAMGESAMKFVVARDILDKLAEFKITEANSRSKTEQSQSALFFWMVLCFVIGTFFLAIIFSLVLARSIAIPLGKVAMTLHQVAEGDLTVTLDMNRKEAQVK